MLIYVTEYEIIFRNDTGSTTHRYASSKGDYIFQQNMQDRSRPNSVITHEHVLGLVEVQPWVPRVCYLLDVLAMVCKHYRR